MYYKEIKDLVNLLNEENIQEMKPKLIRGINELILRINDENISDDELESLCEAVIFREKIRKDSRKGDMIIEGLLIENFIKAFDEFINEIDNNGYISSAIELINMSLRSIGGLARSCMVLRKMKYDRNYPNSSNHLKDLKSEFFKELRSYSHKGIYEEQFVINGLISSIEFELEEKLQEHGRSVISFLTDHKTKKTKSIEEFESENHLDEIKKIMKKEYGIELQRRVYSWNNLMRKLQDHYYLEKLYDERYNELEK